MENENELIENSENLENGEQETPSNLEPTAEVLELKEKNKQLFERAKKAEEKLKEIKPLKEEPKVEPKISNNDPKVMVRLSKALGDFNEEEIDFIYRNSKDQTPEAIIEASKDEWVKTAITARREKVAKENKIPEPSNLRGERPNSGLSVEDISKDPSSHVKAWEKMMKESGQGTGI